MNEINLAQHLNDEQLARLLRLIKQYPDTIKFDRKTPYQVDSQETKLSHSIVKHTDQYGNVFYDMYAKDNEIDGQAEERPKKDKEGKAIKDENGKVITEAVSVKENVCGEGSFGKVKPVIARFYVKDGKLVQIKNPELVVKVFKKKSYQSIDNFEDAVNGEVTALRKNYAPIAVSDSRPAKSSGGQEKTTVDVVMPKLPSNLTNVWHAEHTAGEPTFKIMIDRLNLVIAMLEAVDKFHEDHNAIHGDVKVYNFCYDQKTKVAFLIDFSPIKLTLGEPVPVNERFPHTEGCVAPEVITAFRTKQELILNKNIDTYSLGYNIAWLFNMLIGRGNKIVTPHLPWTSKRGELEIIIADFVQSLMDKTPEQRPEIKEAIQFFHQVRDHYIGEKSINEMAREHLIYEKRQSGKKEISQARLYELKAELQQACSPFEEEVTENARAQCIDPEIYFKKLDFLVLNIEEVIRDIQQQQIRLIHKTEKNYLCDFSEGETLPKFLLPKNDNVSKDETLLENDSAKVLATMRKEDLKKYVVLGKMVEDLELTRNDIKTEVNKLRNEIAQPKNQVNLEQANQWRVLPKVVFKDFVQQTINIISLEKNNNRIIEKQTRFAWIKNILRGIASWFSETKGLPVSAQALITAGHKLGAVMHADAATIEAAVSNHHEVSSTNRDSIDSVGHEEEVGSPQKGRPTIQ